MKTTAEIEKKTELVHDRKTWRQVQKRISLEVNQEMEEHIRMGSPYPGEKEYKISATIEGGLRDWKRGFMTTKDLRLRLQRVARELKELEAVQ